MYAQILHRRRTVIKTQKGVHDWEFSEARSTMYVRDSLVSQVYQGKVVPWVYQDPNKEMIIPVYCPGDSIQCREVSMSGTASRD